MRSEARTEPALTRSAVGRLRCRRCAALRAKQFFVFGSAKGGLGEFGVPRTTPPSPALGAEEPGGDESTSAPRGGNMGLVLELSQMCRRLQMCLMAGQHSPPPHPQPGAQVRKQTRFCPVPAASGTGSPSQAFTRIPQFGGSCLGALTLPLSPALPHTLCREVQVPHAPGWLGRDLIRGRPGGSGSGAGTQDPEGSRAAGATQATSTAPPRTARAPDPGAALHKGDAWWCRGEEGRRTARFPYQGVGTQRAWPSPRTLTPPALAGPCRAPARCPVTAHLLGRPSACRATSGRLLGPAREGRERPQGTRALSGLGRR